MAGAPAHDAPRRIVSVVGTRPQLIKAAVLTPVLRTSFEEVLVDTGQHYDEALAGAFFAELGLPRPDVSLGVGSGSPAVQTAAMLRGLEPILADLRPDAVVVYGDTNSTLAGALVAAKLGIPVAHVEAGLRSFDRRMPEEVNRLVVDHLSSWLFAPTEAAMANLGSEGLGERGFLVGDLMRDLAARVSVEVRAPGVLRGLTGLPAAVLGRLRPGGYLFATVHRAENRDPAAVREWAAVLSVLADPDRPIVLALHPGTGAALEMAGVGFGPDVLVTEPLGYRTSLALQLHAAAVVTDSGGVQREAAWLGVPCLVLRSSTEWVETIEGPAAGSVLVGRDARLAVATLDRLAPRERAAELARVRAAGLMLTPAGAAERIAAALAGR